MKRLLLDRMRSADDEPRERSTYRHVLEHQGRIEYTPIPMAGFTTPVLQSSELPRCAVRGMDPDRSLDSVYNGIMSYFCIRGAQKLFGVSLEKFIAHR